MPNDHHHRGPPPWMDLTYGAPPSPPVTNGWGKFVSGAISSLQAQVDSHHEHHQLTRETLKENREILTEHGRILRDIHGHVIKLQTISDLDREAEKAKASKPDKTDWADRKEFLKEVMTAIRWIVGTIIGLAYLFGLIDLARIKTAVGLATSLSGVGGVH